MPAHVDLVVGDHDQMERPRWDRVVTARAEVLLDRLVGLDRVDRYPAKIAHAMTAAMASTAMTTITMSMAVFLCSRNGLNPTPGR